MLLVTVFFVYVKVYLAVPIPWDTMSDRRMEQVDENGVAAHVVKRCPIPNFEVIADEK